MKIFCDSISHSFHQKELCEQSFWARSIDGTEIGFTNYDILNWDLEASRYRYGGDWETKNKFHTVLLENKSACSDFVRSLLTNQDRMTLDKDDDQIMNAFKNKNPAFEIINPSDVFEHLIDMSKLIDIVPITGRTPYTHYTELKIRIMGLSLRIEKMLLRLFLQHFLNVPKDSIKLLSRRKTMERCICMRIIM